MDATRGGYEAAEGMTARGRICIPQLLMVADASGCPTSMTRLRWPPRSTFWRTKSPIPVLPFVFVWRGF